MLSDSSSELSSVPTEDESNLQLTKKDGILKFFSTAPKPTPLAKDASTPPREREPSAPHEYVLADNPCIAFIVMFRARFTDAFPKSLANFGPQELERGVVDTLPGEHVESFLCALLGLLLNRKQDVKRGHYNRALEEAIQSHKAEWPKDWEDKNPLAGGSTFSTMIPTQRLSLLRALTIWSLSSSEVIRGVIMSSYKQSRQDDDLNQPLSVQPWGSDSFRQRYFLIEGLDDTAFRVYRESNHSGAKRTWWSVAGDIDELKALADRLAKVDGGQKARLLSGKIVQAIPRFEATEEKRKRREYRQVRKQQFKRPDPAFSSYEGRTRGKRIKYTYSDDEDEAYSDDAPTRRSNRNTGTHTPAEPSGPTVTQSGRQVRLRHGGIYGESILSGTAAPAVTVGGYDGLDEQSDIASIGRRPRRTAVNGRRSRAGSHIEGYNSVDEMEDEDDASEDDYGDDEDEDQISIASDRDESDDPTNEDEDMEDIIEGRQKKVLVLKLPVKAPNPEDKITLKLNLTPEKETPESTALINKRAENSTTTQATRDRAAQMPAKGSGFDEAMNVSQQTEGARNHLASHAPHSPSLAYRGSPENVYPYSPAINVGHGGA